MISSSQIKLDVYLNFPFDIQPAHFEKLLLISSLCVLKSSVWYAPYKFWSVIIYALTYSMREYNTSSRYCYFERSCWFVLQIMNIKNSQLWIMKVRYRQITQGITHHNGKSAIFRLCLFKIIELFKSGDQMCLFWSSQSAIAILSWFFLMHRVFQKTW